MVFDAIGEVRLFLDVFIGIYTLLIFLYVLTSWIPRMPYSLLPVQRFLSDVCEPYLRMWRRILPSMGPLDFSPIVGIVALWIVERLIVANI